MTTAATGKAWRSTHWTSRYHQVSSGSTGRAGGSRYFIDRRQPPLEAGEVDHRERVAQAGQGMVQPRHLATVGDACRGCPVRSSCPAVPEGREVA